MMIYFDGSEIILYFVFIKANHFYTENIPVCGFPVKIWFYLSTNMVQNAPQKFYILSHILQKYLLNLLELSADYSSPKVQLKDMYTGIRRSHRCVIIFSDYPDQISKCKSETLDFFLIGFFLFSKINY